MRAYRAYSGTRETADDTAADPSYCSFIASALHTNAPHVLYSSFQRQLNNFGFNKQHKSASPLNSVYVRIKGEQLADVDVVDRRAMRFLICPRPFPSLP